MNSFLAEGTEKVVKTLLDMAASGADSRLNDSLSDSELRRVLIERTGETIGPITPTTRPIYLRKLAGLLKPKSPTLSAGKKPRSGANNRHSAISRSGQFSSDESDGEMMASVKKWSSDDGSTETLKRPSLDSYGVRQRGTPSSESGHAGNNINSKHDNNKLNYLTGAKRTFWPRSNAVLSVSPAATAKTKTSDNNWQYISIILIVLALSFFIIVGYIYFRMTSSVTQDLRDNFPLCLEGKKSSDICVDSERLPVVRKTVSEIQTIVRQRAGDFDCGYSTERTLSKEQLTRFIKSRELEDLQNLTLFLFSENIHWKILPLDKNREKTDKIENIEFLESAAGPKPVWCRFKQASWFVFKCLIGIVFIIGSVLCMYFIFKRYRRIKEERSRAVIELVEKIIDVLKQRFDACQSASRPGQLEPFIAIVHVRDSLIPLQERIEKQRIWEEAVRYLSAHESRVRTEVQTISGEEFSVWRWLPPVQSLDGARVWQGQACKENQKKVYPSLFSCLKVRNMFDAGMEYGNQWQISVQDAILEKAGPDHGILHIVVESNSNDGCVCIRCRDPDSAGRVFRALHGFWFDGRLVTVKYLRDERYREKYPDSVHFTTPLTPSNSKRLSLSQGDHLSVFENS